MTGMTDESSAGASAWERHLHAHLSSHVEAERGLLEEYHAAAEASPSEAFRCLVGLLIEDEIRHHRIFTDLAASLRSEAMLSDGSPTVPHLDFNRGDTDTVIELTDALLQRERNDAEELAHLKRELRDVKDTSLWSLLVDLMERDTQKHIAILTFARNHTDRRA